MGERRFVLYETHSEPSNSIANPVFGGTQVVTEAELVKRLMKVDFNKMGAEEAINILLHGEGEGGDDAKV